MQYEDLLGLVKSRRTIRSIKPDPIPEEMVDKMLEVARWAPTGFNMQPMEFLVVEDLELRSRIKEIIDDWIETDFYASGGHQRGMARSFMGSRDPWSLGVSPRPGLHLDPG